MNTVTHKVIFAVCCGLIVAGGAAGVHLATLKLERETLAYELIGDFVAGLVAVVVALAIHLKYESVYYRFAMERAAIVAELNHHVRNAVFPLCLAVQRGGDEDAKELANESMERINLALRDAITDALSRNVTYSEPLLFEMTKPAEIKKASA
jgi:hypothetical protein